MAMDNYYKLEVLLFSCKTVMKELFLSRWHTSQGCEWQNTKSFGAKLIPIIGKPAYKNLQKIQTAMVDSGELDSWDVTLLSAILRNGNFPGYKTQADIDNENKSIEELTKIRNTLAHLATKTLDILTFEEHVSSIKCILGTLNVPEEDIDHMIQDSSEGAVFAKRRADSLKSEGNELFKNEKYREACERYTSAIALSNVLSDDFCGALYSNRGQSYLKIVTNTMPLSEQRSYYQLALDDSSKSIEYMPKWAKPFKRAGDAQRGLNNWKLAATYYERCIALDPSTNVEVQQVLDECKVMANIRLVANPDDEEGLPMTFDERIKFWNNDPKRDGYMTRKRWFEMEETYKAIGNGQGFAMQGDRFRQGWDVPQDLNESIRCYIRAWKMGNPEGAYRLALMKYRGQVSEPDPRAGFKLLKEASNMPKFDAYSTNWVSSAQFALGSTYERGIGVDQNYTIAADWYRASAEGEHGCGRAALYLAEMYNSGEGCPMDMGIAQRYYKEAAKKGCHKAFLQIYKYYITKGEDEKANETLQQMKRAKLPDSYFEFCKVIKDSFDRTEIPPPLLNVLEAIENRSTTRVDYAASTKPDKFNIRLLRPFLKSSPMARKIVAAKKKCAKFEEIIHDCEEEMPMECIDLYYDAFQSDVEFAQQISEMCKNKFRNLCMDLLKIGNMDPQLDRKLRYCVAHCTPDNIAMAIWLEESVKMHPDDVPLQCLLSNMYGFLGRNKDGLKVADDVLRFHSDNQQALFCRATHLRNIEKANSEFSPEVITAFEKLLLHTDQEDRKRPEYFYSLALMSKSNPSLFKYYYNEGLAAEGKLLPCFLPYENKLKFRADGFAYMMEMT